MAAILVIDDDRAMRHTLVRMLAAGGHSVSEAENGADALRVLPNSGATIVVTDVFMPEKDGIETVREIRALNQDVKILAISGGGRAGRFDFLSVARSFGANAALQKPFRAQALLDAVAALIANG